MMDGMTRIIIEGGNDRLVELLKVATQQSVRTADELMVDANLLASWLAEQAQDPTLETAMAQGSLASSPLEAVMAELIRRAEGAHADLPAVIGLATAIRGATGG